MIACLTLPILALTVAKALDRQHSSIDAVPEHGVGLDSTATQALRHSGVIG